MRPTVLFLAFTAVTAGCTDVTGPDAPRTVRPAQALVIDGDAYTEIDGQVQRLYHFNNCLTGLPPYNADPQCQAGEMTYDVATKANWELSRIFDGGVTTSQTAALAMMDKYVSILDEGYAASRVSCRALYAARDVATTLRDIINGIVPGEPVDLSALPQPLTAALWELNLYTDASYNGTACPGAAPAPPSAAGGYSVLALNSSCADGGRSLEFGADAFYMGNAVHSNASIRVSGSKGYVAGSVTYRCTITRVGGNNYLGSGPAQVVAATASPVAFDPPSVPCTYSRSGTWNLNENGPHWVGGTAQSLRLNPGVYCASGDITLTVPQVAGTVTLTAGGRVYLNANMLTLTAYHSSGVVAYAGSNASDAIAIAGADNSFAGYLYAPDGRVGIGGSDFTLNGSIVGRLVALNGLRTTVISATP